jgi:hypothetical protein
MKPEGKAIAQAYLDRAAKAEKPAVRSKPVERKATPQERTKIVAEAAEKARDVILEDARLHPINILE